MAANKKKIIILCVMVALLVASGYLNYYLTQKQPPIDAGTGNAIETFFASAKGERTTTRNGVIDYCDAIIASASATAQEKEYASAMKLQIASFMKWESDVETFAFGKGYPASIASCSENSIYVTVADANLTDLKVAEIKNFIIDNTNYTLKQIYVRPYPV
jgi:hypothetical protein